MSSFIFEVFSSSFYWPLAGVEIKFHETEFCGKIPENFVSPLELETEIDDFENNR